MNAEELREMFGMERLREKRVVIVIWFDSNRKLAQCPKCFIEWSVAVKFDPFDEQNRIDDAWLAAIQPK